MKRFGLALRAFFRVLGDAPFAERVRDLYKTKAPPPAGDASTSPPQGRSDALTLLATLQREARFLDFVMEPLNGYSDAQVGAAARDVHRDARAVVQRLFAPQPLKSEAEGSAVEIPAGFDPAAIKLSGKVTGEAPYTGRLCHHGWVAETCRVPAWNGDAASALVLAPAEVEL